MNDKLMNLKYWQEALIRLAILAAGMLLGCLIFAGIVIVVGTTEYAKEKYTIFIIGGFMLILVILLVKNSISLDKELRRKK